MNLNMADLFGKMQEMQSRMEEVKAKLAEITAEGQAGGGMVKVTAGGDKRVRHVHIDPEILSDKEMVEDLVAAATNQALENAEAKAQEEMQEVTKGMMPPGMNLSQFGLGS